MKISISATNPCHLYPFAIELAKRGALGSYYSGYPRWKLAAADSISIRTHSLRTNVVYGLLKFAPAWSRPNTRRLFLWQDRGFDRWVGRHLESCDYLHGMPGQCLHAFRSARKLGVRTVLNHATGPVGDLVRIMEPEYARVGRRLTEDSPYDADYFAREDEEYALADFHCAASTVVRDQLVARGIDLARIWTVPYGADPRIFHPSGAKRPDKFRIVFAGQVGLRKGLQTFLEALSLLDDDVVQVDFYGARLPEAEHDLGAYHGRAKLSFHGPVSQSTLAEAFRSASVLVLPSLEEGFGLVVPQALNCGLPAIVSNRVGASDLIAHRENGSIVPVANTPSLAEELSWWRRNPKVLDRIYDWNTPTETLINLSHSSLS